MKKPFFFLVLLALAAGAHAQKINGAVKGILKDSATKSALYDATVSVISAKDSSLISFTLSSNTGFFEIKNLSAGQYVLLVSYQGFQTLKKPFTISESNPVADLGPIPMAQEYKMLEGVVVQDAPIKVKGDTVSFNANYFKTNKPNATAEDLLKKLPGVQVEKDGTVKAQGENVQKIYVDGKEFFGNDPKLATKNITADMIDQVELYDDMSEQAKFSGVDDGSRSKAINLKLKKDKKKGLFGRASAGYGTDERYETNLSANYFKGATKVSVIARSNNTNNIGFTANDQIGLFGGGNFLRGGGNVGGGNNSSGITRNTTAGLNYSDLWGKKFEISGSYFYNNINNTNLSRSFRQTFFPDTINRSQQSFSGNYNANHRLNMRLTYSIDSFSSIIYMPNISAQNSESVRNDSTESFSDPKNAFKINDSRSDRNNTGEGINWTNNIIYRRRFAKRGRTLSVNFSNTYNISEREGFTDSRIGKYRGGNKITDSLIRQISLQDNNVNNYGITLSYTEPIARDKVIEFNYSYNNNNSESDREVFDWNQGNGKYDIINALQTNLFNNLNESNRFGTNYRVVKKKYNYQLGIAAQRTLLQSNNRSKQYVVSQKFTNLFPTASFNYQFARSKNLRIQYRGRTDQPSISQLQPIRDVSNPLYQTEGNPFLKQEYSNNIAINFNSFDPIKFRNLFFRVAFSNTYNKIVNSISLIDSGVQLSKPVNANGAYNANGNFNIGFPIKRMKGGNFNASTFISYNRDVSLANNIKNFTKNLTIGENLRLNYMYKEKLDVGISANINYSAARYTLTKNRNTSFYTYAYSADVSYTFPKDLIISTDLDYTTQSGLTQGFNQSYFLWNASITKQMFKSKRADIRLSVFDILKQNRSINRSFTDNYIEDVQNNVLQRFFMLTFTYNLNRMGGGNMAMPRNGNLRMMR